MGGGGLPKKGKETKSKSGTTKGERAEARVRSKMAKRLGSDFYVKNLLAASLSSSTHRSCPPDPSTPATSKDKCQAVLCEASIYRTHSDDEGRSTVGLEERVYVSEDALEGIRRCVLFSTDDPSSVMEMLLSLPLLPTKTASSDQRRRYKGPSSAMTTGEASQEGMCGDDDDNNNGIFDPLADRAALRLLEGSCYMRARGRGRTI